MTDVLIEAATWVLLAALAWLLVACLLAPVIGGYLRNRRRYNERRASEAEAEAARWARLHGGDPEYRGGMSGPRTAVVIEGGTLRAHLIGQSVERAS